mmetsp:Transcript_6067/g.16997  ORF Transcript_6067/g.16997 Transcript_6067/m.16997 type:complete len:112 (-) Transcript_6067:404-739(-)
MHDICDTDNIMNKGPVMSDKGETFVCEECESTFLPQTLTPSTKTYDDSLRRLREEECLSANAIHQCYTHIMAHLLVAHVAADEELVSCLADYGWLLWREMILAVCDERFDV